MEIIILVIVILINFFLAVLVAFRGFQKTSTKYFSLMVCSIILWTLSNFFADVLKQESLTLLMTRGAYFSAILIAIFFFQFSIVFPDRINKQHLITKVTFWLFFTLFVILSFTKFVAKEVVVFPEKYKSPDIITGDLYIAYMVFFLGIMLATFVLLLRRYFKETGASRMQLRYLLVGTLLSTLGASLTNLIIPYFTDNFFSSSFGPYFTIFFVSFTSYAIVQYRLFDIRIFLRRAFVIGGALTSTLVISLGILYINNNILNVLIQDVVILPVALIVGIILFFWFQKWFLRFANKYFFTTLYDRQQVTEELAAKMSQTLVLDDLIKVISSKLTQVFGTEQYAFATCRYAGKEVCYLEQSSTVDIKKIHRILERPEALAYFEKTTDVVIRDEIIPFLEEEALRPKKTNERERKILFEFKQDLDAADIAVCVPMISNNKLISLLLLGDKLTKDAFTIEDIKLLETVANQAAVAIQNAQLYKASQEFNIKLKAEIEKATKELRIANEKLKELDQAKSEFMSIASHQLRTPLAGIVGYLSMLNDGDYGQMAADQKTVITELYQASQRLVRLVNTFLNVTRIEAGRFTLNLTEVNLVDSVTGEVHELQPTADKKGVKLIYTAPAQPITATVDADKIRDVFLNLIDNAIKYTPEGSVSVFLEQQGDQAHFYTKDTGVGIELTESEHLFEKFVRGSGIARVQPNGSGLGLYIVKKIVEAHQGKVWVESEGPGKGSTFHVLLPLKQAVTAEKK